MRLFLAWLKRFNFFELQIPKIIAVIFISLVATLSEAVGIGVFLPILQFMRLDGDVNVLVSSSEVWGHLVSGFRYVGLEVKLGSLLLVAFLAFMSKQALSFGYHLYMLRLQAELVKKIRQKLFSRLLSVKIEFQENLKKGHFTNIVMTEVNTAVLGVLAPLSLIRNAIIFIVYTVMLLFISVELTTVSCIVVFLSFLILRAWVKKTKSTGRSITAANSNLSTFIVERLASFRLVRISNSKYNEKQKFLSLSENHASKMVLNGKYQLKIDLVLEPFVILACLNFIYFSYSLFSLPLEMIGVYLLIVLRLLPILKALIQDWQRLNKNMGSIEIVETEYSELEANAEMNIGTKNFIDLKENIQFENVSYSYNNSSSYAVKDLNLEVPAVSWSVIVGPSGSGKSTFIDLISKARAPTLGRIFLDGTDICEFCADSLRNKTAFVAQIPQFFSGSIKSHLLHGNENVSLDDVIAVCQELGVHEFIMRLESGYDTLLSENGAGLSGGQKHRLDIARAFLSDASIIILDEPTSALDPNTETELVNALDRLSKNQRRTVIIVTHKIKIAMLAERIFVFDHGQLVSFGDHQFLLENNSWYNEAWLMQ